MHSWPKPSLPELPDHGEPLRLYDTADQVVRPVAAGATAGMYVCGITPYDATHLGHAATYLAFDLVYRQLLDGGHQVHYVQNVTDVDDPLFERAERDGVDWQELGQSQIDLFRSDMEALRVFPPQEYVGIKEAVPEVITLVSRLLEVGAAYIVDDAEYPDIYARIDATEQFGYESGYNQELMATLFAERGGDPDRPGKRNPLDALIWRAARPGEPSWDAPFGAGRPGWHVECSAIASNRLAGHFDIQGGGSDLIFPHHEFSAAHYEAATNSPRMAGHYVHTGMIALDGVKMSKSLGNLVFVSKLLARGVHPGAIRLAVYAGHYQADRDFSEEILTQASERLQLWAKAVAAPASECGGAKACALDLLGKVREDLADNLDTPSALEHLDTWANGVLAGTTPMNDQAGEIVRNLVDALLGIELPQV